MNFVARKSLFTNPLFGWLIRFLDAIPLDREGFGFSGIKESLRRLQRNELVLIFPEGTRTASGDLSPLKPGFCALARRSKAPLVPVAIAGAFHAWPKRRRFPTVAPIHIWIGEPISPELAESLNDEELTAELARRIGACFQAAQESRSRVWLS
jgi:1-acyl-sn-glycerol-3-phosphate acyltransferase